MMARPQGPAWTLEPGALNASDAAGIGPDVRVETRVSRGSETARGPGRRGSSRRLAVSDDRRQPRALWFETI